MTPVLVALGAAIEALAWRLVATGRGSIWTLMAGAMTFLGAIALIEGVTVASEVSAPTAAVVGVGSGLVFYVATRLFVAIVRGPWPAFDRHASSLYGARRGLPLWAAILLGGVVVVTGEELFWRGFVQAHLADAQGDVTGALWTLAAFIGVNVASANLAIIAAAIVGGALWTALALWSGGVLASLLCHGVWTVLMTAFPATASLTGDAK
ncbi:MAG: CPBP family intramembrane glutamic endopeptidase [Actinomycetota bacterium]